MVGGYNFAVLGIAIHPMVLLLVVIAISLTVIVNIIRKYIHRNNWIMQCSRCGYQFSVINPDKAESINAKRSKFEARRKERLKVYAEKNKKVIDGLNRNSQLENDETLLYTIDYFTPHKNSYTSISQLKVTDKFFICYNEKNCFRISRENIITVKKKNYCFIIPTGIQICVNENGKYSKYNFVVMADRRKEILQMLKNREGR